MNKAILMSIKPKRCRKIVNGEIQSIVEKTRPKIKTPFKCYIYCTKDDSNMYYDLSRLFKLQCALNGKVIGEFICDGIDWHRIHTAIDEVTENELKGTCVSVNDIKEYCRDYRYPFIKYKPFYTWHISDLKIYDEPKELKEFCKPYKNKCWNCKYCSFCDWEQYIESTDSIIKRPPQSWCYVKEI